MEKTRQCPIYILNNLTDDDLKVIPYNFEGDIFVNGYVKCDILKVNGRLYATGSISIEHSIEAECIYSGSRISCYGDLKAQDVICDDGPIIIEGNAIVSGDVYCGIFDAGNIDILGDVKCHFIRVDKGTNIKGNLSTF